MSKLIKNELIKIFKKKSIYITLIIMLGFIILVNCLNKYSLSSISTSTYYSDSYIDYAKEQIENLDPSNASDTNLYIEYKSEIDIYDLMQKYEGGSWQQSIISSKIASLINEKNTYMYGSEKDDVRVADINKEIDGYIEKLNADDWRYFANQDLDDANELLSTLEEQKNNTTDKQELQNLEAQIENAKISKEVAQYRLDKNIKYGTDYMNIALNEYEQSCMSIAQYDADMSSKDYGERQDYNNNIETRETSKYIIETGQDVNKTGDLRANLETFLNQYGLFIIVIIVMIAGTIVSEEFNKGTVKLLLVRPYSRRQILMAKFITVLIMTVFAIVAILIMEIIVGGVILGFDSLSVPVVRYDFNENQLIQMNVFQYLGITIIAQLPVYILLATLAFALSTIFSNSAVAIAIPLLGYMSAEIINALIIQYKIGFMQLFVSMNWDFTQYLFGNLPKMDGMNAIFSAVICVVYFLVMMIPTLIFFQKRNIKNI